MKKNQWFYYLLVIVVWMLYIYFTFQAPQTNTNAFNLSQLQIILLRLSFLIPYLVIWLIALHGVLHLQQYVRSIRTEADGKAFSKILVGLWILFLSMILSSILGVVRTFTQATPGLMIPMTIINNYASVFPLLVSMIMLYLGSSQLIKQVKEGAISKAGKFTAFGLLTFFAFCYLWLIFTNPTRESSSDSVLRATYYLPDVLIITTIVIPSLVAWGLGLLAALQIQAYAKKVAGIIYKQALPKFVYGIYFVIGSSILLQALLSAGSDRLLGLGVGLILGIIYFFLLMQSIGFIFIALGSKKLSRLEEVEK